MKWTKAKHGSYIESGSWSIHKSSGAYALKIGWNFVCFLKTEAGCKRVANCIQREIKKDNATRSDLFGDADGCNNSNKGE
jgi:hypothetical protein